ncbi:site-specific integrase [Spirosoma spitsbergense]|uniref:site-specific integrase n=1 Tax=Spirosoma spitsbergense TaxID=431554 RepID=UPI000360D4D3|nr:site-specific integrase [Spirosoma spitsbergense]
MQNTLAADVKFLLKDPRTTDATLVSLIFRYENRRFVYSTGQFIEPYQWDTDNQRAYTNQKNRIVRQQHETINAHLDRHRAAFVRVMNALQLAGGAFDNAAIKHHLDNQLGRIRATKPAKVEEKETFTQFITRFVADAKAGKRLNAKNSRFADGTLKNFIKFRNILTDYQQTIGRGLDYDAFTLDFYNRFKKYLTAQGHSLNYVGAVLNGVKMLLKHAYAEGLHQNTDFQSRDFKKIEEEVDTIYLDNDELTTLYNLDLTHDLRLDRVRDLFLIGCYTGLRFSDYSELRPVNITYGGRILSVTTQKTAARVSIPLNPNVLAILAKYEGVPPRTMSNQKFNQYLKELGQVAGLTTPVERTRTQGGKRSTLTAQKWEMLTTHTARRSFATNAFLAAVPTVSIMKITGHKSEVMFMKYIKVSSEQNALLMLEHPHFSGINSAVPVLSLHKVA